MPAPTLADLAKMFDHSLLQPAFTDADLQTGVLSLVGNHALNPGTSITGAGRLRTDGGGLTVTGTVTGAGICASSANSSLGSTTKFQPCCQP